MATSTFWDSVEPHCDDGGEPTRPCYSKRLKADLHPGTFVLLSSDNMATAGSWSNGKENCGVARIVGMVDESTNTPALSRRMVRVNIFKRLPDFAPTTPAQGVLHPPLLGENHLRHLPEIVQMAELQIVSSDDIINLVFVFTPTVLKDSSNLFFTCQGMGIAFILRSRYRESEVPMLTDVPDGYCLPFPSSYGNSRYHDCFSSRIWNSIMSVKLEMSKLLGRYSHLQGLYCKERCRMSNVTAETWGFLRWQFNDIFDDASCGMSTRIRLHRVTESGLVVKATRIIKSCTILRFETKAHLRRFCSVFGETATAGQRCRLPKISAPKFLWQNDIINVVCGSDVQEAIFNIKTIRDGIDLEFDGRSELFVTVRYRRFAYTASSFVRSECDPLLFALIRRQDPYTTDDGNNTSAEEQDNRAIIVKGSEFEDHDGCLYHVVSVNATHVSARCCYPKSNNIFYGREKSFDIQLAKAMIEYRLS